MTEPDPDAITQATDNADVHHLDKGIIVARTTPAHKDQLFSLSAKIWEGEDYIPTVWDEWINEEGFYTILLEGRVIGCMKYTRLPGNEIMLEGLRMDPEHEGKGYASISVSFFNELVFSLEPNVLRFATSDENVFSHHIADKYGFKRIASFYHRYMKGPEIKEKVEQIGSSKDLYRIHKPTDKIVNTSSRDFEQVLTFIRASEEWESSRNLLSRGWVFYPYTDEDLRELLNSSFSFMRKQGVGGNVITGVILASHSRQYPSDIDISWLSGDEDSVRLLLTRIFLEADIETVQEIAGKIPTQTMAGFVEKFGLHKHPRVDGTHVFEKRLM